MKMAKKKKAKVVKEKGLQATEVMSFADEIKAINERIDRIVAALSKSKPVKGM
jgi:hypothetical protein